MHDFACDLALQQEHPLHYLVIEDQPAASNRALTIDLLDCAGALGGQMSAHDPDEQPTDIHEPLRRTLRRITERLAGELAQPTLAAPDWSPVEWRLARAVAVVHCASPLLSEMLRWEGAAHWRDFLAGQKAHVAARHRRLQELLDRIDARCR
jgi:hypothetical protein